MTVPGASLLDDEDEDEDVDRDLELSDLDEWDSDNEERPRLDGVAKSVKRVSAWKSSRANQESHMIEQVTEGLKQTIRAAKSKGLCAVARRQNTICRETTRKFQVLDVEQMRRWASQN